MFILISRVGGELSPSDSYHHVVAIKRDRIGAQPLARIGFELAIPELPVPMVPRAAHNAILHHHFAFAERGALMWTTVGNGIKFSGNAKNGNGAPAGLYCNRLAFRNFIEFANHVFCHLTRFPLASGARKAADYSSNFDINYEFRSYR